MKRKHLLIILPLTVLLQSCLEDSIKIDLTGAEALYTVPPASESSTLGALGLKSITSEEAEGFLNKILSDGTVQRVFDGTSTTPFQVFIGRDDKIYMNWTSPVRVNDQRCCVVRASASEVEKCYEADNFESPDDRCQVLIYNQIDQDGNLYVVNGSGKFGVKKTSPDGVVTTVYDPAEGEDYSCIFVTNDGTLYFTGEGGNGEAFFRKTTSSGGLQNVDSHSIPSYFGMSEAGDLFMEEEGRYFERGVATDAGFTFEKIAIPLELSDAVFSQKVPDVAGLAIASQVSADGPGCRAKRGNQLFEDASGNIYFFNSSVVRLYPGTPISVTDGNNTVVKADVKGNSLYYSGLDATKKNIFLRVDLTDPAFPATDLLNGEDIEVYQFAVRSNGNVYFGGLRLSDNQLIVGTIDGSTLAMTVNATTTVRISSIMAID